MISNLLSTSSPSFVTSNVVSVTESPSIAKPVGAVTSTILYEPNGSAFVTVSKYPSVVVVNVASFVFAVPAVTND